MIQQKSDASVGQLIGTLATDTGALVRQELRLAATEMTETAGAAARNAGLIAAGGALVHVGCIGLLVALVAALQPYLPLWSSAAIVGLVFAVAGVALFQTGLTALRQLDPVPRETLSTLDPTLFEQRESLR
jgi:hypothetical protein